VANQVTAPVVPAIPQLRKQDYPEGLDKDGTEKFFTLLNPFFQNIGNALNGSLSIGNLNGEIISFTVTTPSSPWLPLTLQSPWVSVGASFEPASYYVDANGRVWLRGVLGTGASTVTPASAVIGGNALITTLPVPPLVITGSTLAVLPSLAWGVWGTAQVGVRVDIGNTTFYGGGAGITGNVNVAAVTVGSALAAPQTMQISLDGISYLSASGAPGALSCFPKQARLVSSQQPVDVWLTYCTDANNLGLAPGTALPVPSPGAVSWSRVNSTSGTNLIQINNITGLALNRTYNIRCWVIYSGGTGSAGAGVPQAQATAIGSNG